MENRLNRILVAIDYSRQSINAAEYISSVIDPLKNAVVLFHVENDHFDIFFDYEESLPRELVDSSQFADWVKIQKRSIDINLERAEKFFLDNGFPKERIEILKKPINKGITRDILAESEKGYNLLVTGKSGVNRIVEGMTGTVTSKLLTRTFHIPLVIVAGSPETRKFILGYDGSNGADKAVEISAGLIRKDIKEMQICHVIRAFSLPLLQATKESDSFNNSYVAEMEEVYIKLRMEKIKPGLQKACDFFVSRGFLYPSVHWSFNKRTASRSRELVDMAGTQNCGSLVLGRRGHSAVKEFFMGRVGKKVVNMAKSIAVWII